MYGQFEVPFFLASSGLLPHVNLRVSTCGNIEYELAFNPQPALISQELQALDENQTLLHDDENQSLLHVDENQSLLTVDENQSLLTEDENQSLLTVDENRILPYVDNNQILLDVEENQSLLHEDENQSLLHEEEILVSAKLSIQGRMINCNDRDQVLEVYIFNKFICSQN